MTDVARMKAAPCKEQATFVAFLSTNEASKPKPPG